MGIQIISLKCPECNAILEFDSSRKEGFCEYCGSKILIHNENEYVYRNIDEAEIKRAETERIIRLKQLEMQEKDRELKEKAKVSKIKWSIILALIAVISFGIGMVLVCIMSVGALVYIWILNDVSGTDIDGDFARAPFIQDYGTQTYATIEAKYRSAGFVNVKCVPLKDLRVGLLKKPNTVESITINGHSAIGMKKYKTDARVVITYHSVG